MQTQEEGERAAIAYGHPTGNILKEMKGTTKINVNAFIFHETNSVSSHCRNYSRGKYNRLRALAHCIVDELLFVSRFWIYFTK